MDIGDLIKYRPWKEGDPDPKSVPSTRRGWDKTGIVVKIGDWTLGDKLFPGEGIDILNESGELVHVWLKDISIINKIGFLQKRIPFL